jgi:hypothetical protein
VVDDSAGYAKPKSAEIVDPRLGTAVAGRYRIVAVAGRGGMGTVYEVEHLTTSKRLALKTLLPEMGRIGELSQRFEREAKAQSRLNHPNIVSVSDFGTLEDGTLFYVMELVRGKSLGDLLEEPGAIDATRALRIARRILEGLAHAHRHGVIHRDLKPDNIMLLEVGESEDERDLVKLVDFGIAKLVGDAEADVGGDKLTQAGVAFGTPDYMAPEQALGEAIDGRADVYSLGVILFEMLAARKPFQSDDKLAVVRMQVAVPPPSLAAAAPGRTFPGAIEKLVARALEKRRQDRFADCEEMIAAIDAIGRSELSRGAGAAPTVALASAVAKLRGSTWLRGGLSRLASVPKKVKIAAGALVVLALLVTLALTSGGSGPSAPGAPGGMPTVSSRPTRLPVPKTEVAARAQTMIEAGDVQAAVTLLEKELSVGEGLKDAYGHLYLGHARAELGRRVEALAAYDRAVSLGEELGRDGILRQNVARMVDDKDKTVAMAALDVAAKMGSPGHGIVVDVASRHKSRELRQRARGMAETLGVVGKVDQLESYALDLKDGKKCEDRREAIPKLRGLKDKRAIPILKKAKNRGGGWFGLSDVNSCLEAEAEEAIQTLEALP